MPRILANSSSTRSRSSDVFFSLKRSEQQQQQQGQQKWNRIDENSHENEKEEEEDDDDIRLTFNDLALPEHIVLGLQKCGFIYPSPVQVSAIPLERLGRDVLVQAKSGTGKTVAFACRLLDSVLLTKVEAAREGGGGAKGGDGGNIDTFAIDERGGKRVDVSSSVKAMCIAPTREIALQTADVLRTLATACAGSSKGRFKQERLACFLGGLPVADDGRAMKRRPACVVGTPGRIKQLVEMDILRTDQIRTVVLDEADQLLTKTGFCQDVLFLIHAASHKQRQLIACSATFSKNARKRMESLTTRDGKPSAIEKVSLCEETVALRGVKMCYRFICRREEAKEEDEKEKEGDDNDGDDDDDGMRLLEEKAETCIDIFNSVRFHQAVIFVESRDRGEKLSAIMIKKGGFKTAFTSGKLPQRERMNVMQRFRDFELRAIVSTDLISRGVDCERVNLVINVDLPRDGQTFMHRCGRTGRFGTSGVAVAVLEDEKELKTLKDMLDKTSKEESERWNIEEGDEIGDEYRSGEKSTRAAFCNLEKLPDTVPESWYAYDLEESDEKRLQALHIEEEKLALLETSSEEEEESSSSSSSSSGSSSSSEGEDSEGEYDDDDEDDEEDFEEIQRQWREKRAYASWWWWHEYRQKVGPAFVVPPF